MGVSKVGTVVEQHKPKFNFLTTFVRFMQDRFEVILHSDLPLFKFLKIMPIGMLSKYDTRFELNL